jgi:hypothetical protein
VRPAYDPHVRAATAAQRLPYLRHKPSALRRICARDGAVDRTNLRSQSKPIALASKPPFSAAGLKENTMQTDRPDSNAELHESFEPLRTCFAVLALLLGVIAAMHF